MGKLSFNMNFNDNMLIKENLFFSNYILSAHLLEKNNSKSWGIKGEFSVGIRALNGKFSVESYYGVNRSEVSQNGILTPIKGESFNIKPALFLGFSSYVNAELNLKYSSYKLFNNTQKNLTESVILNISPNKKFNINVKAQHFANWIGEGVKNTFFLDSDFSYSKGKWRFYLSANNILNQNVYDYNKIIDLTSYTTQYFIRGRNIMFGFSLTF